jgi:hypothetical protein
MDDTSSTEANAPLMAPSSSNEIEFHSASKSRSSDEGSPKSQESFNLAGLKRKLKIRMGKALVAESLAKPVESASSEQIQGDNEESSLLQIDLINKKKHKYNEQVAKSIAAELKTASTDPIDLAPSEAEEGREGDDAEEDVTDRDDTDGDDDDEAVREYQGFFLTRFAKARRHRSKDVLQIHSWSLS